MKKIGSCYVLIPLAILTLAGLPSTGRSDPDALVIIVQNGSAAFELNVNEVRRLFLKEKMRWNGGQKVFPIHAKPGSKARMLFQEKVLRMTQSEESAYWQNQKIKSGRTPPPEFNDIQKAVFSLKGSIGYCLYSEYKSGTSKIVLKL